MNLTPQQMRMARMVAEAKSNAEIALEMGLTVGTVKEYMHAIFVRLKVFNRTGLAIMVINERNAQKAMAIGAAIPVPTEPWSEAD